MVVKSTASTVPPKCQSYNILYRINILIGLILINMFIVKSKQNFLFFNIHKKFMCSMSAGINYFLSLVERAAISVVHDLEFLFQTNSAFSCDWVEGC